MAMGEAVQKCLRRQMAGNLAPGRASHAVADDEDSMLRQRGAGVLVGVAHAAAIGEHGEDAARRKGWGVRRRSLDLRLTGVQSRIISHFATPDHRNLGP
jgi:hypothetical protein